MRIYVIIFLLVFKSIGFCDEDKFAELDIIVLGKIENVSILSYYFQGKKVDVKELSFVNRQFLPCLVEADIKIVTVKKNSSGLKLTDYITVNYNDYTSIIKNHLHYDSSLSTVHPDSLNKLSLIKIKIEKSGSLRLISAEPIEEDENGSPENKSKAK